MVTSRTATSPTGPLWGRGRRRRPERRVLHIAKTRVAPYADWLDPLEHLGLTQQRRSFVFRPIDLDWA